ncbi:MAG: hypothetical protein LBP59_09280 [Planctomycetaceae bacterium]|nr:hypothetical protein [Planctomycetaceae bacterium]
MQARRPRSWDTGISPTNLKRNACDSSNDFLLQKNYPLPPTPYPLPPTP